MKTVVAIILFFVGFSLFGVWSDKVIGVVILIACCLTACLLAVDATVESQKERDREIASIKKSENWKKPTEKWEKPIETWEDFYEETPKHEISIEKKETKKYDIKPEPKRKPIKKDEPCYVYLMKNERNGYHKIGISNNPKYREKTLQAEEPEIKKLVAKRYPNRDIARQIESMLHKNFGSKHLRGEWFNLGLEEIRIVKSLLT